MNKVMRLMMVMVLLNGGVMSQTNTNYIPQHVPKDDSIMTERNVDVKPLFPGGEDGLNKYIKDNLKYPEYEKANHIEGKVYVRFIVHSNGKVGDVRLLRDASIGLVNEAIRLVKTMPDWSPGKSKGKNVPVRIDLPIEFKLY